MAQLNTIMVNHLVSQKVIPGTGMYLDYYNSKSWVPARYELVRQPDEEIIKLAPFIVIFAGYQTEQLNMFEKNIPKGLKVLFKGRPAHNTVHPAAKPGNVIMVVDKDE